MTLGPKFYTNLRSTITRRRKHLFNEKYKRNQLDDIYILAVYKRDLKPSATLFRKFACDFGFAGNRFSRIFARGGRLRYEAYANKNVYIEIIIITITMIIIIVPAPICN